MTTDLSDGTQLIDTYDAHGNMLTATGPEGTITMSYDAADRLTEVDYPTGRVLKYSYDTLAAWRSPTRMASSSITPMMPPAACRL